MSSREAILANIKRNIGTPTYDMPEMNAVHGIEYGDKIAQFIEISRQVGGDAVLLQPGEDIDSVLRSLYPEAEKIASNLPEVTITTVRPDALDAPHLLNGTDMAVVRGEIGVAENGCVWIPQNVKYSALYFIAEYIVIVLDRNNIVNTMHEAYARIGSDEYGFGVFISGPSKTADIEQALVVGAHGARGLTVILV